MKRRIKDYIDWHPTSAMLLGTMIVMWSGVAIYAVIKSY